MIAGSAVGIQLSTTIAGLVAAHSLAPAAYGRVSYFFSIFGFVVLLGSMGLTTQITMQVARLVGAAQSHATADVALPLLLARLGTLALLSALALLLGAWLDDRIVSYAGMAGVLALLAQFQWGMTRGLGKTRLSAALQLGQALLYVAVVVIWARTSPERMYIAVVVTYAASLAASIPPCRQVLSGWSHTLRVGLWRRVDKVSSLRLYLVSLLIAPFGALAVAVLGRLSRFHDAALFSIVMTLTLALPMITHMIITFEYYPRLCQFGPAASHSARAWLDVFYRLFGALAITAVVVLAICPLAVITTLFPVSYAPAALPLAGMAGATGLIAVGQLLEWTLMGRGEPGWALAGAGVQFAVLIAAVYLFVALPALPLVWLAAGHCVAAAAGTITWAIRLQQRKLIDTWHLKRLLITGATATAVALLLRRLTVGARVNHLASAEVVLVVTVGVGMVAASMLVSHNPWTAVVRSVHPSMDTQ